MIIPFDAYMSIDCNGSKSMCYDESFSNPSSI